MVINVDKFNELKSMVAGLLTCRITHFNGYYTYVKVKNMKSFDDLINMYSKKYGVDKKEIKSMEYVDGYDKVESIDCMGLADRILEPYNDMKRVNSYMIKTPNDELQKTHFVDAVCGVNAINYLRRKGYNITGHSYYVIYPHYGVLDE